ncbi:unnamed protein product, partial [Ascophyllum nodosum]
VYSASSRNTSTGEDLAIFLGVSLQLGGYSDVRIVGFSGSSNTNQGSRTRSTRSGRFLVVPYGGDTPVFPNHAECCRDEWDTLAKCNMIVVFVDPADSPTCAEALSAVVEKGADLAIIVFDLSVHNHASIEKHLGTRGVIILAGAVGINVAKSPVDGHLRCLGTGSLVVERLSKDQSKRGLKFVNLLRSGGIPVIHCKNVSSYAHGAIVFNTVHAAAALAGIPLGELLRHQEARFLWAAMIREGLQVLTLAAKGGDWRAVNPCCSLTLRQLELFVCMPTTLFALVSRLVLRFPAKLAPAMQTDLAVGRETAVEWTLGEILRIADKHKTATPACRAVFAEVNRRVKRGDGVPSTRPEVLPFTDELRAGGSDSARALYRKVLVF